MRAYEIARKMLKTDGPGSLDETAAALVRISRIRITGLELLSFESGERNDIARDDAEERIGRRRQRALLTPSGVVSSANCAVSQSRSAAPQTIPPAQSSRINVTDNAHLHLPHARIRISCSKGTYVRAFARDLGEALGSGAYLEDLRRTKSGNFDVKDALSIEEVLRILKAHTGQTK